MSPTGRELYLVVGFGSQRQTYVNSSVHRIRLNIWLQFFRVKVSHLLNFTQRTHQVFFAEQLSRTNTKFPANNVFIQTVITTDLDLIDSSLTAFIDSHFEVDRVAYDIYFYRVEVIEQVTVVVI